MGAPPAAIVSPHLDDAVFSVWSLLTRQGDVRVLNLCTDLPPPGPPGWWDRITGASDARRHMRLRWEEDREALALAGRAPEALGLLEAQYREPPLTAGDVRAALEPALGESAELHAPAGIGGHPDHVAARDAAVGLAAEADLRLFLYADLPYATRYGWPHWVTGEPPDPHRRPEVAWDQWLAGSPCSPEGSGASVLRLEPPAAESKLAAMRRYRTQFPALNGGASGRLESPYLLGYEVVWEVTPRSHWPKREAQGSSGLRVPSEPVTGARASSQPSRATST